ncbi:MAG: response regulator transcription factor [Eubacterium sp.]|jgi:DNA-binding response OmpR family regulator|nr:response regulator transcription factor [Eubacterium sp.]
MKLKLLLVEDSPMIIRGLQYTLEQAGYEVVVCMSKRMADDRLSKMQFDIAILDVNLPDGSGFDLCRQLKDETDIPVIFLTARDEESDVVMGLELGADDYILKPFRNRELISRIETVLRRSGKTKKILRVGDVEIDVESDTVSVKGQALDFTQLEYRILLMLMQNAGQTLTREQIMDRIWDFAGNFVEDNTLTVYIKRIRQKLGSADIIRTIKGTGYRAEDPADPEKLSKVGDIDD